MIRKLSIREALSTLITKAEWYEWLWGEAKRDIIGTHAMIRATPQAQRHEGVHHG